MNSLRGLRLNHGVLLRFSAASTLMGLVGMISGFVILRWVAPDRMGLWQSLLLIQTYTALVQLGVFNGLNRELPFRLGQGDARAMELVSTAQGFSFIVVGVLLCGAIGSFFVSSDPTVRFVLPAVFISSASAIYQQFLGATYRAQRAFQKLSTINFIDAGTAIVTLPLVYYLGYAGLPIRYIVLALVSVGTRHLWRPYPVRTSLNLRQLGVLLKVGVPLYGFAYVLAASESFPRVVLLSRGTLEMVGLLSPAAAMITLMVLVPQSVAQYVYPHMTYRLGETGDPRSLWPTAWKASLGFMALAVPLFIVGLFVVPPMIEALLPKYVGAIGAVRWTLLTGLFLGASISINALNSLKAWGLMSLYTISRASTCLLLPLLFFYLFSDKVEGVAFGYAMAHMVCFFIGLACVHRATMGRKTDP